MSLAATVAAARRELRSTLMTKTCTRYDAAANWQAAGTFRCHYEEASPQTTGLVAFEGGAAGYGVNLFCPVDQPLNGQDRIGVDGITLEVQRVAVVGTADGAKRAACVKRGA